MKETTGFFSHRPQRRLSVLHLYDAPGAADGQELIQAPVGDYGRLTVTDREPVPAAAVQHIGHVSLQTTRSGEQAVLSGELRPDVLEAQTADDVVVAASRALIRLAFQQQSTLRTVTGTIEPHDAALRNVAKRLGGQIDHSDHRLGLYRFEVPVAPIVKAS